MNRDVARNHLFGLSTDDFIDGKFLCFRNKVMEREVNAGHRHAGEAAESIRQRGTIHLVPNQFDVERILADEKSFEVLVNDPARERAAAVVRAKPARAFIRENLDHTRILPSTHPERTDAGIFWMH